LELDETSINSVAKAEIEKFDYNVCGLQRQYDEQCAIVRKKMDTVQEMTDHLVDLQTESEAIKEDEHGATQESTHVKVSDRKRLLSFELMNMRQKIRQLENRLDRAMIKFTEAQSIRKTYEQILKHLQQERLVFDNQISAFESTLKTKRAEMQRLEMMSRDALHAKEIALVCSRPIYMLWIFLKSLTHHRESCENWKLILMKKRNSGKRTCN
jgi:chromosome segregation ATPase